MGNPYSSTMCNDRHLDNLLAGHGKALKRLEADSAVEDHALWYALYHRHLHTVPGSVLREVLAMHCSMVV